MTGLCKTAHPRETDNMAGASVKDKYRKAGG